MKGVWYARSKMLYVISIKEARRRKAQEEEEEDEDDRKRKRRRKKKWNLSDDKLFLLS